MSKQYIPFNTVNTKQDQSTKTAGLHEKVVFALRGVYDPEIPLNLYDLGLIYNIEIDDGNNISIDMTLTTPHCPVAETMPVRVMTAVGDIEEVNQVKVQLVWDPPWNQDRMSDEAKLTLGLL